MSSFTTPLFLLSIMSFSMVFAGVPDQAHLNVNVVTENELTSESIDVNYRDNYVMIRTPRHLQVDPVLLIHDYNQGVTLLKQNGYCFVLDEFDGLPESIEDWKRIKLSQGGETDVVDGDVMNHKNYQYRALPFIVDRSTLPASFQNICSGPIRILVLKDVLEGAETDATVEEGLGGYGGVGEIFLPGSSPQKRVKRQASSGGTITGGRDSNGGYISGSAHANNGRGTSGSVNGGYHFDTRDWNLDGSLSHTRGSWTTTGRGSYHSRGGGSFGGSVEYDRGGLSAGFGADHNTRTHDTSVRATVRWRF